MGLKLALMMLVIMGVLGGLGYWYYQDTQERMAILNENNAKLEQAAATQDIGVEAVGAAQVVEVVCIHQDETLIAS